MSLELLTTFARLTTLSALIVFLLFYTRRNLWGTQFQWIGLLLLGSVSFDVLSQVLYFYKVQPRGLNNSAVNSWIVIEFIFCSVLYLSVFRKRIARISVLILTVGLTLFGFYDFFFLEGPIALNTYMRSVACIVIASYSIYFFFQLLTELPASKLTEFPMFWISAAMLLYFSGTFILNISISYLINTLNSNLIFFWVFMIGLNFVKNILFGIGSWYQLKSASRVGQLDSLS